MGRVVDLILDAVFPRYCLSCQNEGSIFCTNCTNAFDDVLSYEEGEHFASFAYGNPAIRDLIKTWKYSYDHSAFEKLRQLAEPSLGAFVDAMKSQGVSAITFVPLSPRRFAERGFNQAEGIARWLSKRSDIPMRDLLKRKDSSGHQAERTDEERAEAMKLSPFTVNGSAPSRVLIVDDVWTTGSTLRAAERSLKEGGVEDVLFYTLAKGR